MESVIPRFFSLIRWKNLLILLITQWFAYSFLSRVACFQFHLSASFFLIAYATLSIAAAGYIINDYFDVKIDSINKPGKLIVEKYISRRWVLVLHPLLTFSGIVAGALVSYHFALLNLMVAVLLWLYSAYFKKTFFAGNILVAFLMSLTLWVVAFATPALPQWLLFYGIFAFLTGLIREVIKDVQDMEGDAQYASHSIPVRLGFFHAKVFILVLCLLNLALLMFAIVGLSWKHYYFLATYLGLLIALPLLYFLFRLRRLHHPRQFASASFFFKWVMLLGIISMALRCA